MVNLNYASNDIGKSKQILEGKVAIVTGAGQGMGKGIVNGLSNKGASIVLVDKDSKGIEEIAKELTYRKCKALAVKADVSISSDVNYFVSSVMKEFGRIDILVNNAGIGTVIPTTDVTEDEWDKIVDVNLKGVFLCSQAVSKEMIKRKQGKIINTASPAGHSGIPQMAAYCASKGGVISLTRSMAVEWAKYGITVNSISPGMTETPLMQKMRKEHPEIFEERVKKIPLGRTAQIQDIVNVVVFLASPESDYINGVDIIIDGGLWALHSAYTPS
jgi:NAD(P)-dependent dehydrogenase (short-subunit alcohol dehydrogenase family)